METSILMVAAVIGGITGLWGPLFGRPVPLTFETCLTKLLL